MTPADAIGWVDVLRNGGGWAMFCVSAVVNVHLWKACNAKDQRLFDMLTKQNDVLKVIQEKTIANLTHSDRSES